MSIWSNIIYTGDKMDNKICEGLSEVCEMLAELPLCTEKQKQAFKAKGKVFKALANRKIQ